MYNAWLLERKNEHCYHKDFNMLHFQRVQVDGQICFWDIECGLLEGALIRNMVKIEMKEEAHYNKKSMDSMVSQNLYDCILTLDLLIARFMI